MQVAPVASFIFHFHKTSVVNALSAITNKAKTSKGITYVCMHVIHAYTHTNAVSWTCAMMICLDNYFAYVWFKRVRQYVPVGLIACVLLAHNKHCPRTKSHQSCTSVISKKSNCLLFRNLQFQTLSPTPTLWQTYALVGIQVLQSKENNIRHITLRTRPMGGGDTYWFLSSPVGQKNYHSLECHKYVETNVAPQFCVWLINSNYTCWSLQPNINIQSTQNCSTK